MPAMTAPSKPPGRRILLIDDDVDLSGGLAEVLEEAGYRVTCAPNGQAGLAQMQADLPDLVLLDLLMPVMNGWMFCQAIKEDPRLLSVPVIAMSAAVSKDPGSPYFIDVFDFVAKPIDLADLLAKIEGALPAVPPS
jgi:two-component system, chemotaxis family, chemotaxis protein CheY